MSPSATAPAEDHAGPALVVTAPRDLNLDPAAIRSLSSINPWASAAHIAMEWSLIVIATVVTLRFFHPLTYLVAVAFIGARQHSLGLILHDAAHYRLARNRRVNDWIGEALLSWPFIVLSMRAYRRNHFPHHAHLNTDDDPDWVAKQTPDWVFPQTRRHLFRLLLEDALGVGFIRFAIKAKQLPKPKAREREVDERALQWGRVIFVLGVGALSVASGTWHIVLMFWIVPFLTWFQLLLRVRSIAEHFAITGRAGFFATTRSTELTWFDRIFFLSNDASLHGEHHLFPSVPFYRLRTLQRLLMSNPTYAQSAHRTRGYIGVLRECLAPSVARGQR